MNKKIIPFANRQQTSHSNQPIPKVDNRVVCALCKTSITLRRDKLKEDRVTLEKECNGSKIQHDVVLTQLMCPNCGKSYVVLVDDEDTLDILSELKGYAIKRMKYFVNQKPVPKKLQQKYSQLDRKLDFKRQKLAEKFDGALYQIEGDTIQLDYRHHAR